MGAKTGAGAGSDAGDGISGSRKTILMDLAASI